MDRIHDINFEILSTEIGYISENKLYFEDELEILKENNQTYETIEFVECLSAEYTTYYLIIPHKITDAIIHNFNYLFKYKIGNSYLPIEIISLICKNLFGYPLCDKVKYLEFNNDLKYTYLDIHIIKKKLYKQYILDKKCKFAIHNVYAKDSPKHILKQNDEDNDEDNDENNNENDNVELTLIHNHYSGIDNTANGFTYKQGMFSYIKFDSLDLETSN